MIPPDPAVEEEFIRLEPPYKSQGEAQVGRLLDRYGIPFFYEQPLIIYDKGRHHIWHPDFTLPDFNSLLIEYAGIPDQPEYMAGIQHKERVYKDNEIPAMFVFPPDLKGPNWSERLYEKITKTPLPLYESKYYK